MSINLETGDVFSTEVTTVTRSGLGAVKYGHDTISIGPVTCDKGTLIHVKYLGEEQDNSNTTINYGLCLTERVVSDDYGKYIENMVGHLIPDRPPEFGEIIYAKIDDIDERNIGVVTFDGQKVCLGPVRAQVGDLVQISGVTETAAEVLTESAKGDQYENRFNILTGQLDSLPISEDEEYTTVITSLEGETPVSQIIEVPITFPNETAAIGQKVDVRVVGFEHDRAVGEILKAYDEVGRVENLGHWGRMQLLRKAGFGSDPFRNFAAEFIGVDNSNLPQKETRLRTAIISETVRLCLEEKASHSDEAYPRAHITGIRHWVTHKLSTVLGRPDEDEDEDWFREVLTDGKGQTLTFLGDILELSNGYYAMSPTRVIMIGDKEGVLVSGRPTSYFRELGLDIEFQGISRRIVNTTESDLRGTGLTIQALSDYLGTNDTEKFDADYLVEFIQTKQHQEWVPESSWEAYTGNRGYGFDWGDDPLRVETTDGWILSLWRIPVEYGADEFQVRIESTNGDDLTQMVRVPNRFYKQVCLALDAMSGLSREVEISPVGDDARLSCDFAPPRAQTRWLSAIGSQWEGPRHGKLHWRIDSSDQRSIEQAFSKLPVKIKDTTNELTN